MTNSERNDAIDMLLKAAELDAEGSGASLLDAARMILKRAENDKRERDLTPYERGYRDATECRGYVGHHTSNEDEYAEGYADGQQHADDLRVDQIECDYLDGLCTLSGSYYE